MSATIRFGEFAVDPIAGSLRKGSVEIPIGARALGVLTALATAAGEVVPKEQLLRSVWPGLIVEEANLAVQISGLRRILGNHRLIKTIPGIGYRLAAPVKTMVSDASTLDAPSNQRWQARYVTGFVGRVQELDDVERLLESFPAVSINGPAGIGKSRLANEVVTRMSHRFSDGTWRADLYGAEHRGDLVERIASALLLEDAGYAADEEDIHRTLEHKQALLLLDNCDDQAATCYEFVEQLVRHCPGVRVICTARHRTGHQNDVICRCFGLATRMSNGDDVYAVLGMSEAARLFCERAHLAGVRFRADLVPRQAIERICELLQGVPLAIEIVASHASTCALPELEERLSKAYQSNDVKQVPHADEVASLLRALRLAVSLMGPKELAVLAALTVFRGGWTAEAAHAVCVRPGMDSEDVHLAMTSLAAKSLVTFDASTNRSYCHSSIPELAPFLFPNSEEQSRALLRHQEFFLRLAREAGPQLSASRQDEWLATMEAEALNLRRAMQFRESEAPTAFRRQLQFIPPMKEYWLYRGWIQPGRRLVQGIIAANGHDRGTEDWCRAISGLAWLDVWGGRFDSSLRTFEQAEQLAISIGDPKRLASVRLGLATALLGTGDLDRAHSTLTTALALAQEAKAPVYVADALGLLSQLAYRKEHFLDAAAYAEDAVALADSVGNVTRSALSTLDLVSARVALGERVDFVKKLTSTLDVAKLLNSSLIRVHLGESIAVLAECRGLVDGASLVRRLSERISMRSGIFLRGSVVTRGLTREARGSSDLGDHSVKGSDEPLERRTADEIFEMMLKLLAHSA